MKKPSVFCFLARTMIDVDLFEENLLLERLRLEKIFFKKYIENIRIYLFSLDRSLIFFLRPCSFVRRRVGF